MIDKFDKTEYIYNRSIGDMGIYMVMHKILPNELAMYNYDIVINIETVDMDKPEEVEAAHGLLINTYEKLRTHWKFENKVVLEENKIRLLEG